jgi:hypothetical protein
LSKPFPAAAIVSIAAVTSVDPDPVLALPPAEPVEATHRSRSFYFVVGGCVAVVLLAAAFVAWNFHNGREWWFYKLAAQPPVRSIAVLPLLNLSSDPDQQFFADGVTDELITNLAQIGSLRVISHTSAMAYSGTHKSTPQIARELGVEALVEGFGSTLGQPGANYNSAHSMPPLIAICGHTPTTGN